MSKRIVSDTMIVTKLLDRVIFWVPFFWKFEDRFGYASVLCNLFSCNFAHIFLLLFLVTKRKKDYGISIH